jgi:hypothetical protein
MRALRVTIPEGVEFADLCLSRDVDDGRVRFSMARIEAICEASALDLDELVDGPQPLVVLLIAAWYRAQVAHRTQCRKTSWERRDLRWSTAAASHTRRDTPEPGTSARPSRGMAGRMSRAPASRV